jgi:hypothetical protein
MVQIAEEIGCPDCGAPLKVKAGEAIITCEYCGSDVNLAVGKKYFLKHSIIPCKYTKDGILKEVKSWMKKGFLKPSDLARKSRVVFVELRFLPFFVVHLTASTKYEGVFTRTGGNINKKGDIVKEYYWKVLGRRGSSFPTRSYEIPVASKADFNISLLSPEARFLNSEIDEKEAENTASQEVKEHQKFLLSTEVDHITDINTTVNIKNTEFLHAPAWFVKYEYRGKTYELIMDGATGDEIKAEIPPMEKKGVFGKLFGS